jgi:MFS family permease
MSEPQQQPLAPRYAWYGLGVLFSVNLVSLLDRNILAALLPLIQTEYGVSDQWTGLLGASFIWVFMLTAPPFGYAADRRSRTAIIAACLATWSLATAASGLVPGFIALFITRAVVGVGEAGYAAAAPSMIADFFPPWQRTRALSIYALAFSLGAGLGFVVGGFLGETVGWRNAFFFAAAPGLVLTPLVWSLREPVRGAHDTSTETETLPLRRALARLVAIRSYLAVLATGTLVTFAIGGVAVWLPTYLVRVYAMSLGEAGVVSGTAVMLGSLAGTITGGMFAERLSRHTPNALVYTIASSLAVTALLLPLFLYFERRAMLVPILLIINFFLFWHIGPVNTLIANVSPPNVRALAVSIQMLVIHLLGDAFSPALIGAASDALQAEGVEESEALRSVLLVLLPVPVFLAAICAAVAGRWAPADMRRVVGEPEQPGAELATAVSH